jgi:uncharacterized protein YkwD
MTERLPFAAPGSRVTGDGDGEKRLAEARRLMFQTKLVASTAGVPTFRSRHVLSDGAVLNTQVDGPIERLHVHHEATPTTPEEVVDEGVGRLVWLPEGLMITPRTPEAEEGFGIPNSTPGAPLKQVIINRFVNNNYPENLAENVWPGNIFFFDWELTAGATYVRLGANLPQPDGTEKWTTQFAQRFISLIREAEGTTWLCHRPEYGQEDEVEAAVRAGTNALRAEVDMPPLQPPLRGQGPELAVISSFLIQDSGALAHDCYLFRPGHTTFAKRLFDRSVVFANAGENVLVNDSYINYDTLFAQIAVAQWRDSPRHYANMIADWHEDGAYYASVSFASVEGSVRWSQPAPYQENTPLIEFVPPIAGRIASQVFLAQQEWLYAGQESGGGVHTVTINDSQDMFIWAYQRRFRWQDGVSYYPQVGFAGRRVFLTADAQDKRLFRIIAAGMYRRPDNVLMLRAVVLWRATLTSNRFVRVIEGQANDFLPTVSVRGQYLLDPVNASFVGRPKFSASGERVVFSIVRTVDAPDGYHELNLLSTASGPNYMTGQEVDFIEWTADDGFVTRSVGEGVSIDVAISVAGDVRTVETSCVGIYRLFADYDGETLVYGSVEVNNHITQRRNLTTSTGYVYDKQVQGSITWPDGTNFVYADISMTVEPDVGANVAVARGMFRHLLPFSMQHLDHIAYVEFTLPSTMFETMSAKLMVAGALVKENPNALGYPQSLMGLNLNSSVTSYLFGASTVATAETHVIDSTGFLMGTTYGSISTEVRLIPTEQFRAAVVGNCETQPRATPRGLQGELTGFPVHPPYPDTNNMAYTVVGPHIIGNGWEYDRDGGTWIRDEDLQSAYYKGEYIHAGVLSNPLGFYDAEAKEVWSGDARYYRASSLNLETITGLIALSDNIIPLGAI